MLLPAFVNGCMLIEISPPVGVKVTPDVTALEVVVRDAYGELSDPETVYVAANEDDQLELNQARIGLTSIVNSEFLSPLERTHEKPGASVLLGDFFLREDGRLSVSVSFISATGSTRGCLDYTLESDQENWIIADRSDIWPDCPISGDSERGTFHSTVERAQSDGCTGLWTHIGTCGDWLYAVESTGFTALESFFDRRSGLIVAQRASDDTGFNEFVFGEVVCEASIAETFVCNRE